MKTYDDLLQQFVYFISNMYRKSVFVFIFNVIETYTNSKKIKEADLVFCGKTTAAKFFMF